MGGFLTDQNDGGQAKTKGRTVMAAQNIPASEQVRPPGR
jgi:hypothetical protein